MANEQVRALYNFLFQDVMLGVPSGFTTYNPTDAELATLWSNIYGVDISGKMDLVPTATLNNFASFDAAGQVKDSLKNADTFALKAHTHTNYLLNNADNTYDATLLSGYRFTWHVLNESPFDIDNTSGDILPTLTHLNADLVDGRHASYFAKSDHTHAIYVTKAFDAVANTFAITNDATHAPFTVSDSTIVVANLNADLLDSREASYFAKSDHAHTGYPLKAGIETITGDWTFDRAGVGVAPFILELNQTGVVQYLNADKLDGLEGSGYSLSGHSHAWGIITGTLSNQADLQAALDLKMAKPTAGGADGNILVWDTINLVVLTSPLDFIDLATTTQIALKYDEVAGVNNNFPAFATLGPTFVDSGYAASDFAAAAHTHNDLYFTETELTNNTTNLALANLDVGGTLELTTTQAAGAQAGTISNVHTAGNPNIFFKVISAGINYAVPGWTIP